MAHNPFLSMGEPVAPVISDTLNPFMIAETEPEMFSTDNPFATSNPFSDFGSVYDPPAGDIVPMDIFGTIDSAGGEAKQYEDFHIDANGPVDIFANPSNERGHKIIKPTELDLSSTNVDVTSLYSSEEELNKPKRPPPPARPLPAETQNLILSVTGQMDFTSSHLLDRIPPTRTPSPVSMRDIHSPSPTPEVDPLPEDEPLQIKGHFEDRKHPELDSTLGTDVFDINQNKPSRPTRPPPARPQPPLPRPPPPRPMQPPPIASTAPASNTVFSHDDINLFDAPIPAVIKPTKEAILSLYSMPKKEEEKQIDFLSDDISEDVPLTRESAGLESAPIMSVIDSVAPSNTTVSDYTFDTETYQSQQSSEFVNEISMDCSAPPMTTPVVDQEETTTITISSQEISMQPAHPVSIETSPFADSVNGTLNEVLKNPFQDVPPSVFDTDRSPFNSEVFDTEASVAVNDAVTRIPSSEPMVHDGVSPKPADAFDAFSAKFDSTFSNHIAETDGEYRMAISHTIFLSTRNMTIYLFWQPARGATTARVAQSLNKRRLWRAAKASRRRRLTHF